MIYVPCKECENHDPHCHGKCEVYKDFLAQHGKAKEAKAKADKEWFDYYYANPYSRERAKRRQQ
jgi:hypothetical protein